MQHSLPDNMPAIAGFAMIDTIVWVPTITYQRFEHVLMCPMYREVNATLSGEGRLHSYNAWLRKVYDGQLSVFPFEWICYYTLLTTTFIGCGLLIPKWT